MACQITLVAWSLEGHGPTIAATSANCEASAALGRELAALLDCETPAAGVTSGDIRPELKVLGIVSRDGGGTLNLDGGELAVTAGWGHGGKGGVTMPGKGKYTERSYTLDELKAIEEGAKALGLKGDVALKHLGASTFDVYLNGVAFWRNVPCNVWEYTLGGYQVIKKWLSYRERELLGRDLNPDEARHVTETVRRIAAILLLELALNGNYAAVKAETVGLGKA